MPGRACLERINGREELGSIRRKILSILACTREDDSCPITCAEALNDASGDFLGALEGREIRRQQSIVNDQNEEPALGILLVRLHIGGDIANPSCGQRGSRRLDIDSREDCDGLWPAIFKKNELCSVKSTHRIPLLVEYRDVQIDEVGSRPKDWLWLLRLTSRARRDRRDGKDANGSAAPSKRGPYVRARVPLSRSGSQVPTSSSFQLTGYRPSPSRERDPGSPVSGPHDAASFSTTAMSALAMRPHSLC